MIAPQNELFDKAVGCEKKFPSLLKGKQYEYQAVMGSSQPKEKSRIEKREEFPFTYSGILFASKNCSSIYCMNYIFRDESKFIEYQNSHCG